jgi:hypothetical protein
MYVKLNIEGRSRNHCCRVKATHIKFFACVSVALGLTYNAQEPYYIVICGLSGCTISFHITS